MYRWSIELERKFVLPLAPRWVRHSYLSKEATILPYTCALSPFQKDVGWGGVTFSAYSGGDIHRLIVFSNHVMKFEPLKPSLSAFWERGSPDLPACSLRCGSSGGPMQPSFIISSSRPSRGAKPRGADDRKLPQEQPHQAGTRGGGENKAGYLARYP